ncbi:glycosyltransferase family 4 protein [Flavobacterium sp.]|uniref:glycosyltransferase family 4 protein n=1 Tax=Flavobacterium sp. TaxID=239 RepID=UPI0037511C89
MTKKKKILYVGNNLSKHGFNTTYIEILGHLLEKEGFNVTYSSSIKNQLLRMIAMFIATIKNSIKVNYIIIDTYSTFGFYYALITSQVARIFNTKYIAILHGGNLPVRLKKSPFLCDLIFKNAYLLVAPSGYLLNAFKDKYPTNLLYIPNTIQLDNYTYREPIFDVPKLLWVRSFSKIYNPKMAIDVVYNLKKTHPNAQLCMVGPDNENLIDECIEYAKNLNVQVKFTGKLLKSEWIELSKEYNVFINTTHFDNTPISVIEAMALGLPVVSTNVGGIPFLLSNNETALLVDDNDATSMTRAIIEIFENDNLAKKISHNSRFLVESFDWKQVKQKWIEILK